MLHYVYILQSQINFSFYKGATQDLAKRMTEHNLGQSPFTKKFKPWNLVWFTLKNSKTEAAQLEIKLKNLSVQRTIAFIKKYPPPNSNFQVMPWVQR
ncbi:MAG: GIY-YIG nuclease family protein [Bacteroidetes bacterium]|nr:GIY-YIG nuclease family protein [Bacteroidota bacterium]